MPFTYYLHGFSFRVCALHVYVQVCMCAHGWLSVNVLRGFSKLSDCMPHVLLRSNLWLTILVSFITVVGRVESVEFLTMHFGGRKVFSFQRQYTHTYNGSYRNSWPQEKTHIQTQTCMSDYAIIRRHVEKRFEWRLTALRRNPIAAFTQHFR